MISSPCYYGLIFDLNRFRGSRYTPSPKLGASLSLSCVPRLIAVTMCHAIHPSLHFFRCLSLSLSNTHISDNYLRCTHCQIGPYSPTYTLQRYISTYCPTLTCSFHRYAHTNTFYYVPISNFTAHIHSTVYLYVTSQHTYIIQWLKCSAHVHMLDVSHTYLPRYVHTSTIDHW